jgi:hypothetical protein
LTVEPSLKATIMESINRYTAIVKRLQALDAEVKQVFENGILQSGEARIEQIMDEIYTIGKFPNTNSPVLDLFLHQCICYMKVDIGGRVKTDDVKVDYGATFPMLGWRNGLRFCIKNKSLDYVNLQTTLLNPIQMLLNDDVMEIDSNEPYAKSYGAALLYISTVKAQYANDPTNRIVKLEKRINTFDADKIAERIAQLAKQYTELQKDNTMLKTKLSSIATLEQQVKELQEDNTMLKAKLSSIEQAVGLDVKYDYYEIYSRIEPFRNELLLTQRIFARILRGRYSLPIAIPVAK